MKFEGIRTNFQKEKEKILSADANEYELCADCVRTLMEEAAKTLEETSSKEYDETPWGKVRAGQKQKQE